MSDGESKRLVDQFILDQIDSVPHLEALLLMWNSRPKKWTISEMGKALYVRSDAAERILNDLVGRELIVRYVDTPGTYFYQSSAGRDNLLRDVDTTYRRELIRISQMIHSKASLAVRDFARAFRLKKD